MNIPPVIHLQKILEDQKSFFIKNGPPDYKLRLDRLNRVKDMLISNKSKIVEALDEDYGVRSLDQSLITDVYAALPAFSHAIKNLKRWMKPEKRQSNFPYGMFGARSYIHFEPLGTVGMISPWNFPFYLSIAPLAGIFSAGNQAMHKPSEFTPITADLMKSLCDEYFDEVELATVTGGIEVGEQFSSLKFDHLLFTGSGNVGKKVMQAAAQNLVPVTLELGGKSPVIIGSSANIEVSARRIMFNKTLNAGQICLAPDYVFVQESIKDSFIQACQDETSKFYDKLLDNNSYTSVVNAHHYDRLISHIEDAKTKGATIIEINPAKEDFSNQKAHKIPPTLIVDATDDMTIMQEEIFGPLLPICSYTNLESVIAYINAHDKPLGLYYFGTNKAEEQSILNLTSSGGVTINDCMGHIQQNDLGFGGVGPSGMGKYDGKDGFLNFSNCKTIYKQVGFKFDKLFEIIRPPYKGNLESVLKNLLK